MVAAEDALLEACRLAPDDDAPRLVWADAVGGERGEIVVIQCDLARGGLAPAEAAARRRRERELLARHRDEWIGLGRFPHRAELRRGFVEAIELDASAFVEHGEEILRRAPLLRSLTATGLEVRSGDPLDALRALLATPAFRRLRGLSLRGVGIREQAPPHLGTYQQFHGRGDEAARLLAESGALAQLSALGISRCGLGATGARRLIESGALAHLEKLWLHEHGVDTGELVDVIAHAVRLKALYLYNGASPEAIASAMPPVIELHLAEITDAALAALGNSRAAPTLEALRLSGTLAGGDGFRAFPRLQVLDVHGTRFRDLRAAELAAALPSLRRLRFTSYAPAGAFLGIARALGPQLEELDLGRGKHELGTFEELQPYVAGEVIGSAYTVEPLF